MHVDSTTQKVLGYLGRALSLELSAVQLYSTQARLVANWGLDKAAERFRAEAREEMQHVERIIARLLSRGAAPGASQLRPVTTGPDLLALLEFDRQFELELAGLYGDAVEYCRLNGEVNDLHFFQVLLEEEQQHGAVLDAWINSLPNATGTAASQVDARGRHAS